MLNSIFHAGTFSIEAVLTAMAAALILGLVIESINNQESILEVLLWFWRCFHFWSAWSF